MNNIYHWQSEVMVNLEMENFKREIESIRLIRDAGLSNPGWLERTIITFGDWLVKWGQHLHKEYTAPTQAYHTTSSKFAS